MRLSKLNGHMITFCEGRLFMRYCATKGPMLKSILLLVVLLTVLITVIKTSLALAEDEAPLYAYSILQDKNILDITVLNNTVFAATAMDSSQKNPFLLLVMARNNSLTPHVLSTLLPGKPVKIDYDGRLYVVTVTDNGFISVIDINELTTYSIFGIPGDIIETFFINKSVAILSKLSREVNSTYILTPGTTGWGEARLVVGTLLPTREEGLNPVQLVPIVKQFGKHNVYPEALVLYEKKPYLKYTLVVYVATTENSTLVPLSGALVYVYATANRLVGQGIVGENGLALIPIEEAVFPLKLIVEVRNNCYSFQISEEDTILVDNTINVTTSIVISNMSAPSVCPKPERRYVMAVLRYSNGKINMTPLGVDIEAVKFRVLWAQRLINDSYFIIVGGQELSIGDIEYKGTGFAYLIVNSIDGAFEVVDHKYYSTVNDVPIVASASIDSHLFTIGTRNGMVYIAGLGATGYELLWPFKLVNAIRGLRVIALTEDTYLIAAYDDKSFNIYAISLRDKTARPLLGSNKGIVLLPYGENINDIEFLNKRTVIIATNRGAYIIKNINKLMYENIMDITEILVKYLDVNIVDEYGRRVNQYNISYNLLYGNTTIDKQSLSVHENETISVPCINNATLTLMVAPLNPIYTSITKNVTCTAHLYENSSITIKVPLHKYKVNITFVDEDLGSPPQTILHIIFVNTYTSKKFEYNVTVTNRIGSLSTELKAGEYNVSVIDISGKLYNDFTFKLSVYNNTSQRIVLERKPIRVIVRINSEHKPKITDTMIIEIVDTLTGNIVFRDHYDAPRSGAPVISQFDTTYRGTAILRITFKAPEKEMMPYYENVTKNIQLYNELEYVEITLQPKKYRLEVNVRSDDGHPIDASIIIKSTEGEKIAEFDKTSSALTFVTRGEYVVIIDPSPINMTNIRLYENKTTKINVYKDIRLNVVVKKLREFISIILVDPFVPNGGIMDNVTIYLDGAFYKKVTKSPRRIVIRIPVLMKGSKLSIKPETKKIYTETQRDILIQDNGTVVNLERRMYTIKLVVIDDEGNGVKAASVNVQGIDVIYTSSSVTDVDGLAALMLPYGTYNIQVTARGYEDYQLPGFTVTGDATVSIILKPRPFTILKRYLNIISAIIFASVLLVFARIYFKRILEKLATEEEF